jgi:UDP-N-acetylmuramate dehydrogenase
MLIEENKQLAPFTTFGIGGPARWFCESTTEDEIVEAAAWAAERGVPLFVLGGGSNLLVSDVGFDGLVLKVGLLGIAAEDTDDGRRIYRVGAGESWDHCVERTTEENCAGIECLAGIPGTVGGTPVQNVGAYGQEVSTAIARVRVYDLEQCSFVEFTAGECGFAYRHSRFNSVDRGRYIVTRVDYRLTPGGAPTLRYGDLQRALAERAQTEGRELSLVEVAALVRRVRKSKGMCMVEGDPDCQSAGSFFKNPVVDEELAIQIAAIAGKEPPRYTAGLGQVKLPAAWLIEQAGFAKGYMLGSAGISSRHTLALINRGGATAAEVLALAEQIIATVDARFAVHLVMEPVRVGF